MAQSRPRRAQMMRTRATMAGAKDSEMSLTFGSLFAGIGGFDLGFERASMACKWQVEKDEWCQKVLAKHWPHVPRFGDIHDVGQHNLEPVDVICGGFPCQPFSDAGNKRGKTDDRYLWPEMLRIIRELKPRWVIGENVAGFITMELDSAFTDLETEGYQVEAFVLPAYGVGAPHQRNRVWIVAYPQCKNGRRLQCPNPSSESLHQTQRQESPPSLNGSGQALAYANGKRKLQPQGGKRQERGWVGNGGGWQPEPAVGRVAHGVPNRVDRLRGLGNAVVPQIAEHIGRLIVAASQ